MFAFSRCFPAVAGRARTRFATRVFSLSCHEPASQIEARPSLLFDLSARDAPCTMAAVSQRHSSPVFARTWKECCSPAVVLGSLSRAMVSSDCCSPPPHFRVRSPLPFTVSPSQKYSQTLHRLGRVSALLAVSLPHALFVCFGGLLWLLAPSAVAFLATQTLLKPFLSTLLPLGASILLVHDNLHTTETPLNCKTPGASKTRPRTAVFSRTHPKKQEPHLTTTATAFADTLSPSIEDRTQFWLEYWIVHASLQCLIAGLNALPFIGRWMRRLAGMNAVFSILELFFYVWIYTMPYLLPQHHHYHSNNNSNNIDSNNNNSSAFPEGRPLRVLSRVLRPIASRTVSHIASIVSPTTWDTYIINTSSPFLQLAVTLRIISLSTNQWIQTAIQQGRFVVLPFLWLFVPVPGMASFAVLYTQFFLPLSKTAKGSLGSSTTTSKQSGSKRNNSASKQRTKTSSPTRNSKSSLSAETDDLTATATLSSSSATWPQLVALQYWILHSLITVIIHKLSYVLWVIPFSNVVLFVFWWYLSWNVSSYYQILERDLQLLGVLQVGSNSNDGEHGTVEATTVYRVCTWILERLPSAAGVNATMDEAGEHAAMVGDDDDDKPGNSDSDDEDELSDCQFPTETQDNLVKKADRDESKGGQSRSKSPATRQRNSARTKPKEST